jgi:hypothetical protein
MRIRSPASALLAAALLAIGLAGCQQLFTTSLAASLARDSISLPSDLSPSQAADLAKQAKDNDDTKLATALVSTLVAEIPSTTNPKDKKDLEASAAEAAIVASGTSGALTDLISAYANGTTPTTQSLIDLVATIKAGATPDVVTALSYLDTGLTAADAKAAGLQATDLAIAAVIIASTVIPPAADPTTFDYSSLPLADQATYNTALNILTDAKALVDPGSESEKLLNDLLANFNM